MPASIAKTKSARVTNSIAPPSADESRPRRISSWLYPALVIVSLWLGILSGYSIGSLFSSNTALNYRGPVHFSAPREQGGDEIDFAAMTKEINPMEGYQLPVPYGDLGPRLLASGAINYDSFAAIYQNAGDPLTQDQVKILKYRNDKPIVITPVNAHFLLNFFWAVGLANKNQILTNGMLTQYSNGQIDRFASTGGWTLGTKPVKDLFASTELIPLTAEQQARLEQAASAVYRPCCDNPTIFPDCNHGMAMLGLLELMASKGANADEMFEAAKHVNAYWFPQQALEVAVYLKSNRQIDFAQADGRIVTGKDFFSGSGESRVHVLLQSEGRLPSTPNGGGNCGS